jgi:hypothetical protein
MDISKSFKGLFQKPKFDPSGMDRKFDSVITSLIFGASLAVAVISGGGVFYASMKTCADTGLSFTMSVVLSSIVATAMYFLTDKGLKFLVTKFTFDLFQLFSGRFWMDLWAMVRKDNPKYNLQARIAQGIIFVGIGATIVAVLFADYKSIQIVQDPVADLVPKDSTIDIISQRQAIINQNNPKFTRLQNTIASLEDEIKATEKSVERKNPKLDGMEGGKPNGWEKKELSRLKASATSSLRKRLDETRTSLMEAEKNQEGLLAVMDTSSVKKNILIENKNIRAASRVAAFIMVLGFWAKVALVFFYALRVFNWFALGAKDTNGDGKIDTKDVEDFHKPGFQAG